MNILILTGRFGMGHYSASHSLRQQIQMAYPAADIAVEDLFAYAMPEYSDMIYKSFSFFVSRASGCYNAIYKCTENKQDFRPLFLHYFMGKLRELLELHKPDILFSTLPICSQIASRYKGETGCAIPLVTCITDISNHAEWINQHTDYYMVGSRSLRKSLAARGVPAERIVVSGIPVRQEFRTPAPRRHKKVRELLIMGGGLGLLPKADRFYEELDALPGVHTTIIAGGNQKLYDRLHGRYPNIEVVGFTDRVYAYMRQADLVISKPGGITLFETVCSETPMLVFSPFLHQEMDNTDFILQSHIGRVLESKPEDCVADIRSMLFDDAALARLRRNIRRIKAQFDDSAVLRLLFTLAPQPVGVSA